MSMRRVTYVGSPRSLWRRFRDSDIVVKLVCVALLIDVLAVASLFKAAR
jgi:hypothetical protein